MLHDSATIQANHDRFVMRVAVSEIVWKSASGYAICPSNEEEGRTVLMFWSDRGYTSRVRQFHFPKYEPSQISLFDFLFRWIPGMERDKVLAGTNWNGDLAGLELAPGELRREIFDAMGPERIKQYIQRFRAAMEQQGKG